MKITNWSMDFMGYQGLACETPCSMYSVLLAHKLIQDPFWGTNEYELTELSEQDCRFCTEFEITSKQLERDFVELQFYGLDTLCDIYLNGTWLAHTENMHRKYTYEVKELLQPGMNRIELCFKSPMKYFEKKNAQNFMFNIRETLPGASHLRKALYMSGWDWGPKLPDMGIFRDVEVVSYDTDRLDYTIICQEHRENAVDLRFDIATIKKSDADIFVEIEGKKTQIRDKRTVVTVDNPKLWWVRGYGEQPLYTVRFTLEKDGNVIDCVEKRIGLRTLTVSTKAVKDGNEFCFVINGVKMFAMGANYIPQDNLYARITPETTRRRIDDFLFANFNCIRVWGGGYYPEDYFFDMCDEEGLLVWEDIMMACSDIYLSENMEREMIEEVTYNINRISHHASLGLICGNNEIEVTVGSNHWGQSASELTRMEYLKLYERLLPDLSRKYAPDTFYWSSSPSSGGGFDNPQAHHKGDVHYWDVWTGSIPFEAYREHKFRFCSEYGFQCFPNMKTIRSFCEDKELNLFSYTMDAHQKQKSGNVKMLMYLSDKYLYPSKLEDFVYLSQILQAEAIKLGVEHFRRIRGYCMGSLYWQANDCWPVASWSSVDYYGRYKALHYAARTFYAPIAEGIFREDDRVIVNVANETMTNQTVSVKWSVCRNDFRVIASGEEKKTVKKLCSSDVVDISLEEMKMDEFDTYFYADLYDAEGNFIMRQTELFTVPRFFRWLAPNIQISAEDIEGGVEFTIVADAFAKNVELDFAHHDVVLSDNYFCLTNPEAYRIHCKTEYSAKELLSDLMVKCVNDIK